VDSLFAPIFNLLIGLAVTGVDILAFDAAVAHGPRVVGAKRQRAYDLTVIHI
jgi:hypothetical protein